MSSMNFSTSKQYVRPPQRGIFPLDHDGECRPFMEVGQRSQPNSNPGQKLQFEGLMSYSYLECLKTSRDTHHRCRDLSKDYLQCRMDKQLMSEENLDNLGYAEDKKVHGAHEYDKAKEKAGFVAGKHIAKKEKWWFQKSNKGWKEESSASGSSPTE